MNYKVVYFTRTGTSERVAKKIANKLYAEAIEITDNINWKGIFGFIKGGYYISRVFLKSQLGKVQPSGFFTIHEITQNVY